MAKIVNTVTFKNAYISLEENTITEIGKDSEQSYNLADAIARFEGKLVTLTIKEDSELGEE